MEKMANFEPNHGLTPFKKCQFFDFLNFFFCSLEKGFFVLEYHKTHFPGLYHLKKKVEKQPILDQNHGLTPLGKWPFFDFLNFLFLQPRKAIFFLLESHKRHFPGLYCLQKKKMEKMANFDPKPWTTPFGKISIFRLLELLVFIAQKGAFSFQNIIKHIFLAYTA